MKKLKTIRQVLLMGHLLINVPVLLIILVVPLLAYQFGYYFGSKNYGIILLSTGMLLGIVFAWIRWS